MLADADRGRNEKPAADIPQRVFPVANFVADRSRRSLAALASAGCQLGHSLVVWQLPTSVASATEADVTPASSMMTMHSGTV